MFDLTNKVALVTGARRGMGKAHALALASHGARIAVTDIDETECQAVVQEIENGGGTATAWKLDVTSEQEIDRVFGEVVQKFGSLDILVNNAGVFKSKAAFELSREEWERTLTVNLTGEFLCAKRAAQEMKKKGYGRIINISSIASGQIGIGIEWGVHYTASKGGILGMTKTLALEWAEHGITVNAVAPGAIDTPMLSDAGTETAEMSGWLKRIPLGRIGKPEEVSAAVVFLASDEASYMTGTTIYVDGGWLAA